MRCTPSSRHTGQCRATVVLRTGLVALALLSSGAPAAQNEPAVRPAEPQPAHHDHQGQPQTPGPRYTRAVALYTPPDVTLVDMTGAATSLVSVLNHAGPLLLQFIFTTCPTICPVLSEIFSAAQDRLGPALENVRMVSISIDPEHDTPARLQAYARQRKARRQWRFLTGKREDIVAMQKAFDAYQDNKMRHAPLTYLRAAPEAPWVRFDGFMSAAELVAEYDRLLGR